MTRTSKIHRKKRTTRSSRETTPLSQITTIPNTPPGAPAHQKPNPKLYVEPGNLLYEKIYNSEGETDVEIANPIIYTNPCLQNRIHKLKDRKSTKTSEYFGKDDDTTSQKTASQPTTASLYDYILNVVDNICPSLTTHFSMSRLKEKYKTFCQTILFNMADDNDDWPLRNMTWVQMMSFLIEEVNQPQSESEEDGVPEDSRNNAFHLTSIALKTTSMQQKAKIYHATAKALTIAKNFCQDNREMLRIKPSLRMTTFARNNAENTQWGSRIWLALEEGTEDRFFREFQRYLPKVQDVKIATSSPERETHQLKQPLVDSHL